MKNKIDLSNIDPVELKPFLGLRPGIVVLIALFLCLLLALFLLFILPGLISNTSYVSFDINAHNVAIYDNGKYLGSSEGSVYRIVSGKHTFSFKLNGLDTGSMEYNSKKHIFFTLFHRAVDSISYNIENSMDLEEKAMEYFAHGVAISSKVIDYSTSYHLEPYFSDFAFNASSLGFSDISDAWLYGALHITSKEMYVDYINALSILEKSNIEYLSDDLRILNTYLEKMYVSSGEALSFNGETIKVHPGINGNFFTYPATSTSIGKITALSYPEVNEAGTNVEVDEFSIAKEVVSEYMYAQFVEENPYWSKQNKEKLISDGVVDDNYLNGINLSTAIRSLRPIRNISYYSAMSYTQWLSSKEGIRYSLPTEKEWIIAGKSAEDKGYSMSLISVDNDSSTPSNMLGQLWEFTNTSYIPLSRLINQKKLEELRRKFSYDDIVVKGGSYINSEDNITINTVGAVEKSSCSEYIGFRVVFHE